MLLLDGLNLELIRGGLIGALIKSPLQEQNANFYTQIVVYAIQSLL